MKRYVLALWLLLIGGAAWCQNGSSGFKIGISVGANASMVSAKGSEASVISGTSTQGVKTYSAFTKNLGKHFGFDFMVDLNSHIGIASAINYVDFQYQYSSMYAWQGKENFLYQVDVLHKLRWVDIPLWLEYRYALGAWQPYVRVGGWWESLLAASSALSAQETNLDFPGSAATLNETQLNTTGTFVPNQFGAGASLGIRYDFGKTTLDLELAYRRPFTAATNVGSATANTQLWGGYYDTVDDTQMNHFWLTLRVLSPFGLGGGGSGGKTKGTVPCPSFH